MEASIWGFSAGASPRAEARGRPVPKGSERPLVPRAPAPGAAAAPATPRPRPTAWFEHALFALTLGTVGYIWLGALLAEAAQGL